MPEETISPISAPKPPAVNPLGAAAPAHASTLKLKPVIRKPGAPGLSGGPRPLIARPAVPGAAKPAPSGAAAAQAAADTLKATQSIPPAMEHLKTVTQKLKTQKLKGVTQQIPQQAILRQTGIIADQGLTEAQKQASKSRTSRISLSDAIGVAPVANEAAPMKTIRIRRPIDVRPPSHPAASGGAEPAPLAPVPPQAASKAGDQPSISESATEAETSVTQRKTLKVSRPGGLRPAPKLGLKRPGAAAAAKPAPPAEEAADGGGETVATLDPVTQPPVPGLPAKQDSSRIADVPPGLLVFNFILQFAACCAMGFLGWLLYTDLETAWF